MTLNRLIGSGPNQVSVNGMLGDLAFQSADNVSLGDVLVDGDITLDDGAGTFVTTLQTITPTANRTISLPNATGTVALVAGSSGQLIWNSAGAQAGVPGSVVGATGDLTLALNGAASTPPLDITGTWFTGGTSTTTKPQVLVEPAGTTSTAWSTAGTGLGVNAASGFVGRLLDLQLNGTSNFSVDSTGRVSVPLGTAALPSIYPSTDTNTGIYSPGADQVAVATNGTGRLFVDANGKIFCNSTTGSRLEILNSAGTAGGGENLHSYTTGYYIWGIRNETNALTLESNFDGNIIFKASNNGVASSPGTATEKVRITPAGLVGIGTSSPSTLLHLNSAAATNTTLGYSENGALKWYNRYNAGDGSFQIVDVVNTTTRLHISNTGAVGIGSTLSGNANNRLLVRSESASAITNVLLLNNGAANNNAGQGVRLNLSGISEVNSDIRYAYIEAATQTTGNDHYLAFGTNAPSVTPVERMRIDSSGRLLVGTSTSQQTYGAKLEIVESRQANGIHAIAMHSDYLGPLMTFSRGSQLVSNGNSLGEISFRGHDGTDKDSEAAQIRAEVDGTPGANDMPGRLVFSTTADGAASPTERMRIDSSGRVGIGTTSPSRTLDVVGTAKFSNGTADVTIYGDLTTFGALGTNSNFPLALYTNGTERARIDSSGRVGIGTSAPTQRLTIFSSSFGVPATSGTTQTNGAFRIGASGTSGVLDFGIGAAGTNQWIQSTDSNNLSLGYVLFLNPNGGNVGIGINASNTSGGVLQLSSGLTFPATAVASADPNTLDDYEEGTWTPTQDTFDTWTTPTFTATYTKVGRVVHLNLYQTGGTVGWSALDSIGGLPFTPGTIAVGYATDTTPASDNGAIVAYTNSKIYFQKANASETGLVFSVTYHV